MTYIHYGSDHFAPALFDPVRNGGLEYGFRPKPADGTGLWASREGDPNGWEAWCRGARFNLDALSHSFRFTMQGRRYCYWRIRPSSSPCRSCIPGSQRSRWS